MDDITLQKALSRDKKAFSKVYEEYFDGVWRYVYSRIKNKDITSDIISESFIALYENIQNIKYPTAIKSYLYRIVQNKLIQFYASEKPILLSTFHEDTIEVKQNEKRTIPKQIVIKLEEVLSKLPKIYEDVLRLRFLAHLSISEVADILGKSTGNIKVMQNRAIRKAQELVNELYLKSEN